MKALQVNEKELKFELENFLRDTKLNQFKIEVDKNQFKINMIKERGGIKNFLTQLPKFHLGKIYSTLSREKIYDDNGR